MTSKDEEKEVKKDKLDLLSEEYLLTTTPEERARVAKEGLGYLSGGGVRAVRQEQSVIQIQAERLKKLMERIDVPLPSLEPEPEYVPPPRELRSRQIHGTISGSSAGEYHVYRLSRRREFANTQRAALEATLEKEKNEFAQQLEEKRKLDELQTEKKRLKRLKKKQNKNAKAQDQNKSDKSNTTNAKQPIEITSDTPKAEP